MPMPLLSRIWLVPAGLAGASGVALAALAAHGGYPDPDLLARAAEFLLLHAPALVAAAWLADRRGGALPQLAGAAFLAGLLLFSGTLALHGAGFIASGLAAPAGGIALIAGWFALAASALARRPA
jgi:uncharacterized membrane protein YgdD (TMEM256/DUF423 family)